MVEALQKIKYSPSVVVIFEIEANKTLSELQAESLGKRIVTDRGQTFEVTSIGAFTSIVKSKTPDLFFLMSGEVPFERIHKDSEHSFREIVSKGCKAGRCIWLFKLEMVPWVFDPES